MSPYVSFAARRSQKLTTQTESGDCENKRISVGQKKLENEKFCGFTGKFIRSRLSEKPFERLDAVRQRALLEYWKAVLEAEDLSVRAGEKIGSEPIIYGQDIRVLDFFGSRTFEVIEQGERLES